VPSSFIPCGVYARAEGWTTDELEKMDAKFRQRLLDAIAAGDERCTVGKSTAVGTRYPVTNYRRE
jgi:hypothetical protein